MSNEVEIVDVPNNVRGFMVYEVLYHSLEQYALSGDGYHCISVFDEDVYTDSQLVDASVINLMKLLATGFGLTHVNEAVAVAKAMQEDDMRKKAMRFRSRHPLFANGSPLYQNVCLISGMIHLGIPILPYFNGQDLLVPMDDNIHIDVERMTINNAKRRWPEK